MSLAERSARARWLPISCSFSLSRLARAEESLGARVADGAESWVSASNDLETAGEPSCAVAPMQAVHTRTNARTLRFLNRTVVNLNINVHINNYTYLI